MENLQSRKAGGTSEAFTLVEVLIVLSIISLIFTLLFTSLTRVVGVSLDTVKTSEKLKEEMLLFWELKRSFVGAKEILIKEGREVYLITSGGNRYKGVVKKAYIFKDNYLYLYEFPYPIGSIDFYEEDKLMKIGKFASFRVYALDSQGKHENFKGIPPYVIVELEKKEFTFKIR
ncbi:MAG: prepilin-type cleavage/methylation domain-containing protein [Aquifex sp.]|nr:MAG: prepilin-type cleavage/methylation domain-containing protein [Aquifex sp.]